MKKVVLLCLMSCICLGTVHSQTDSAHVEFVAYWWKGDVYKFRITKWSEQWNQDTLSKLDSSQYIATFEVLDSTEKSYKIKWSFSNDLANTLQIPAGIQESLSKYKDVKDVIYETTEYGEFVGILNWEELSDLMKNIICEVIQAYDNSDPQKKKIFENAMSAFGDAYSSRTGIEKLLFKEIPCFHFPFGVRFSIDEPILYEDKFPNLFGGDPIKANAEIYFDYVDYDNQSCRLIQETTLDSAATKIMLYEAFQKMGIGQENISDAISKGHIEINDYNTYEYFYDPGIPIYIETKRESIFQIENTKVLKIEKTRIELIDE